MKILHTLTKILEKINNYVTKIEEKVIVLTSLLLVILTLFAIVNRYFLKYSLAWYEEVALILYFILVYYGTSNIAKDDNHIKLTLLSDVLKVKNAAIYLNLFSELCCLFVSIMGVYISMKINLITTWRTASLNIPNSLILFFSVTLGFFCLTLRYSYRVLNSLNKFNKNRGVIK